MRFSCVPFGVSEGRECLWFSPFCLKQGLFEEESGVLALKETEEKDAHMD